MIIVYCIDSIHGVGGIQRVTLMKANALAAINQNMVWIIFTDGSGQLCFPLSANVHTINLGINYYEDDWKSKWHVLKGLFIKRTQHKRKLKKALNEILPDVVISVGQSEKNLLPAIQGKWATVREFHFARDYRQLHARSVFDRILAFGGDFMDRLLLGRYDRIVVLTQEDYDRHWQKKKNVSVIPNPAVLSSASSSLDSKRILAVGRLAYPKNFTSLIRAFSFVASRFPEWSLDIYGEGNERESLSSEILTLGLSNSVWLMGNRTDIQSLMTDYSLFAMTSRFEGFGMVLVEAMSCGLPVVSYACPCGPKDIIRQGVDGFLVPPGDENMLADRICQLIEDESLRKEMGTAAHERAKHYSIERILPMWMSLFEELTEKKNT